jgi:hypothetical protein
VLGTGAYLWESAVNSSPCLRELWAGRLVPCLGGCQDGVKDLAKALLVHICEVCLVSSGCVVLHQLPLNYTAAAAAAAAATAAAAAAAAAAACCA